MILKKFEIIYKNEVYVVCGINEDDAIKKFREDYKERYGIKPRTSSLQIGSWRI